MERATKMIMVASILVLLGFSISAYFDNRSLRSENVVLSNKLESVQLESEKQKQRMEDARVIAEQESISAQSESEDILDENVTSSCEGAIWWGADKAKSF